MKVKFISHRNTDFLKGLKKQNARLREKIQSKSPKFLKQKALSEKLSRIIKN